MVNLRLMFTMGEVGRERQDGTFTRLYTMRLSSPHPNSIDSLVPNLLTFSVKKGDSLYTHVMVTIKDVVSLHISRVRPLPTFFD